MSLIGLVRQAINGQARWADVEKKAVNLAENGALDVIAKQTRAFNKVSNSSNAAQDSY